MGRGVGRGRVDLGPTANECASDVPSPTPHGQGRTATPSATVPPPRDSTRPVPPVLGGTLLSWLTSGPTRGLSLFTVVSPSPTYGRWVVSCATERRNSRVRTGTPSQSPDLPINSRRSFGPNPLRITEKEEGWLWVRRVDHDLRPPYFVCFPLLPVSGPV